MPARTLETVELWDGRTVFCNGFLDGLPVWRWRSAPKELLTKTQIWDLGRRRKRGAPVRGLLRFHKRGCGLQLAELFHADDTQPSRAMSPRWLASIAAMHQAHRTCRRCEREYERYMPTSTWNCWDCMDATGDYGQPADAR